MNHLFVCPEYPPAPTPPGGIGTYVDHISRLLADAGETVHVIGTKWAGAPESRVEKRGGRLIVHRVGPDAPIGERGGGPGRGEHGNPHGRVPRHRAQRFSHPAALLAERLVRSEGIELIEAQEYDAPLYHFLLRRALGLGPARTPPCLIHLHSPTEFIHRYNGWDTGGRDYQITKRMEEHCIAGADAFLCPSRYLARQSEEAYGLPEGSITVRPLPAEAWPKIPRDGETWERDRVCYLGRLEPRKGVLEWVEAAGAVADEFPTARFDFVGADAPHSGRRSVRETALGLIPPRLRSRFRFHGSRPRSQLRTFLARSSMAVVPSRWENFPNTCIEAMASGLPVIASPAGGMAEMVEDGRSGWIAPGADPAGLAEALRRALRTPAADRRAMGDAAAERISRLCCDPSTLDEHLEFRSRIADGGASRSRRLPVNLPWARHPLNETPPAANTRSGPGAGAGARPGAGVGVVLLWDPSVGALPRCLESLRGQRHDPVSVVVAPVGPSPHQPSGASMETAPGWETLQLEGATPVEAMASGYQRVREDGRAEGILFLSSRDRLASDYLGTAGGVLRSCPEVDIVSPWMMSGADGPVAHPCPAFPYQLLQDEVVPAAVFRLSAVEEAGGVRRDLSEPHARWDLANAILETGGRAVTLPGVHVTREPSETEPEEARHLTPAVRRRLLERVPRAVQRDALELVVLLESGYGPMNGSSRGHSGAVITPRRWLRMPLSEKLRLLGKAVESPAHARSWLIWHLRGALARTGARIGLARRVEA